MFLVKKAEAESFVLRYIFFNKGLKYISFSDLCLHCENVRQALICVFWAWLFYWLRWHNSGKAVRQKTQQWRNYLNFADVTNHHSFSRNTFISDVIYFWRTFFFYIMGEVHVSITSFFFWIASQLWKQEVKRKITCSKWKGRSELHDYSEVPDLCHRWKLKRDTCYMLSES